MLRENISKAAKIEQSITSRKQTLAAIKDSPKNELGFALYTKPGFGGNVTLAQTVFEDERTVADVKNAIVNGLNWELKELEAKLEALL